ncbi:MAG: methyltransferase domain-containing protein [Proteobacteria bacterium]|nr:methyltransferase domain-containing protein [Pseudomonadota bacterium]
MARGEPGPKPFSPGTMIQSLLNRRPAEPWSHGGKIPWDDPAFSARMLREHLSQEHDRASRRAAIIDEQVAWIHGTLLGGREQRILDLGCGPGLYSSRLARLGHRCVGLDFSPASIEYARDVASREHLACDYALADLQQASLGGPHEAALLLFGELNTFPRLVARHLLRRLRAALAPGARVVLEVQSEAAVRSRGAEPATWSTPTSSVFSDRPHLLLRECSWHEAEAACVERYFVVAEGSDEPTILASTTQAYSAEAYRELLSESGLVERERYPCLTGRSKPVDPGLFVIVAAASG